MSGPPTVEHLTADHLTADRWRRFGHDRLYVRRDGTPVGWWDLVADHPCATRPEEEAALRTAVLLWRSGRLLPGAGPVSPAVEGLPSVLPPVPPRLLVPVAPPSPSPSDRDLARNQPGAALLAHLAHLRQGETPPPDGAPPPALVPLPWFRRLLAWVAGSEPAACPVVPVAPPVDRSWRAGSAGEQRVGARLSALTRRDPLWQALHSVPVGSRGSDIDHVVMGPGGVFTLNTKHHRNGRVWVRGDAMLLGGHHQPYVRNSRHEAARASRILSAACGFLVPVRGLVVTVGALATRSRPLSRNR